MDPKRTALIVHEGEPSFAIDLTHYSTATILDSRDSGTWGLAFGTLDNPMAYTVMGFKTYARARDALEIVLGCNDPKEATAAQ